MTLREVTAYTAGLASLFLPSFASAHEVYVLSSDAIRTAIAADSPNPFTAYTGNEYQFFFWGLVSFVAMTTILATTAFHLFERQAGPFFAYIKRFAHPVVRITVGVCLIGFGLSGHLFGTELALNDLFASFSGAMQAFFLLAGIALITGLYTRYIAALLTVVYVYAVFVFGSYVFTYTGHLGAYVLLLLLGSGTWSLDHAFGTGNLPPSLTRLARHFVPYAFPVLRICFGFSIMFAAVYGKFIHSELGLQTVLQYHLTDYFHFDPLFIALGSLIIEFLAGAMIFLGIAIRWTGLFLIFWLTLSQLYFHEIWWLHVILFGIGLAIFCHGYDRYSLEGRFFKRHGSEPIL